MVTAVKEVKKIYQNSIIGSHADSAESMLPHREAPIIENHTETAIFKLFHRVYSSTEGHPATDFYRLPFEGILCLYCCTLDDPIPDEGRVEDRFAELVTEWRRGTGGLSSPKAITTHPAYQQIMQIGEAALPMIFRELQENGGWWYPALRALTRENPVPEEAKGQPPLNREAWLEWGRRNGYLQP